MEHELNVKYKNITRECLMIYLNLCELCERKGKTVKKGLVVKAIISSELNSLYVLPKPLTHKRVEEVAYILLDIFTTFGAPCILQISMWEELKIVHDKPRHSQSQGSVERANQDVENMLAT
ncbi:KRAB-A domain-containing protein 2-like [Aphis craccivora]|uniref:KRAB-A domain-containing protein 2-like n=1 Tax=Aphis craccivora TaxID=307492 RepID=A0A6G0W5G5_APHCR|nr:KRAB-A domain-containing protein 2-like [Aphis craccivora]